MTQMPQSSGSSGMGEQEPQDQAPAPAFQAYLPSTERPKHSPRMLIVAGAMMLVVIAGLAIWTSGPDDAEAEAPVDVGKMTPEQLVKDASMGAARELLRRQHEGTPAERAAANKAMSGSRSARLTRNLAMAMALRQQNRAHEMNVRMRREMQTAERGH